MGFSLSNREQGARTTEQVPGGRIDRRKFSDTAGVIGDAAGLRNFSLNARTVGAWKYGAALPESCGETLARGVVPRLSLGTATNGRAA